LVTDSKVDAASWVDHWIEAGPIVIEDFLDGPEVSVFAVCTESGAQALEPARDYKRLLDGDEGPNTGGMGSYSPVADLPADLVDETMANVIGPTLQQMTTEGTPFRGFLYAGLVLTEDGPKVLEFNVRLGDPETQAVLPRMANDLIDVLEGAAPQWSDLATVNVVLAAQGYPTSPQRGDEIKGTNGGLGDDVLLFHAGTVTEGKKLFVDGGRVLNVVGIGPSVEAARDRAYAAAERVRWPGMQFRRDIAG
jgi:phosphoribosylamine--glycine ligase